MKKILFALCAILMAVVHANAQSTTIATLSHGGNITAYYGSNALIEAIEAADNGDIISLSPGLFNAVNISKAVTLRGSGFDNDSSTGRQATYITGDFNISAPTEGTDAPIIIEGIHHNGNIRYDGKGLNLQIIKSRLYYLSNNNIDKDIQITMINCKVIGAFSLYNVTATCINSIINHLNTNFSSADLRNCYLNQNLNFVDCIMNNCVLNYTGIYHLDKSNIMNNCIYSGSEDYFSRVQGGSNTHIDDLNNIFESFSGDVDDNATYALKADAKTKYIGNDGTEIGIYGGVMPFSSTPSSPQITKFKVAEKSTADGKLSIDITINMPK